MFGLKFKSWMETHIVRSRKKQQPQQRSKDDVSCSKVKLTRKSVTKESLPSFRTSPFIVDKDERFHHQDHAFHHDGVCGENIDTSSHDEITDQFPLTPRQHHGSNNATNLSSPESAYSTGYSTDGTSPGTTFPPEYYINIRTGTHYFHSEAAKLTINCKPQTEYQVSNGNKQTLFCCAVKEKEQFGNLLTKVKDFTNVVSAKKSVCDDISQNKVEFGHVTTPPRSLIGCWFPPSPNDPLLLTPFPVFQTCWFLFQTCWYL
uniref:Uncharacterized protein n=1 Tax=Timema douglasi TaxID=61478 RepID=A0A7R8VL79_TIMDO|nr:unnamed protein product [Timema douglasi]